MADTTDAPDEAAEPEAAGERKGPPTSTILIVVGVLVFIALIGVGLLLARKDSTTPSTVQASGTTTSTAKPTGTTKASVPAANCTPGDWPASYKGRPKALDAPTEAGVFVWQDAKGWHIRAVDPKGATPFAGKVTATAPFAPNSVKSAPDGAAKVTLSGNSATFELTGGTAPAGIDFPLCDSTQVSITIGSGAAVWPADKIWVGASSRAVTNPIVAEKAPAK